MRNFRYLPIYERGAKSKRIDSCINIYIERHIDDLSRNLPNETIHQVGVFCHT